MYYRNTSKSAFIVRLRFAKFYKYANALIQEGLERRFYYNGFNKIYFFDKPPTTS